MEAVVLAGGFGARLQSSVKDLPKPMAPVHGKPFLTRVLNYLRESGVSRFILSVGYKYETIQGYFGNEYRSTPIVYAVEKIPLGTGGGIKRSLEMAGSSPVLVVNGDTFFDVDLDGLLATHRDRKADMTIAVKYMDDLGRYGSVVFDESGRLISFREKGQHEAGYVNGGLYVIEKDLFAPFALPPAFSFETDFMEVHLKDLKVHVRPYEGYFIDIGLPGDYEKAQQELSRFD